MSEQIYWILSAKVNEGQLELFKDISAQLVEQTESEPDTLSYEWSLSEDSQVWHVFERYTNSAAVGVHLEKSAALVGELFKVSTPISFVIYGPLAEPLKAALEDLNPTYMTHLGGFNR